MESIEKPHLPTAQGHIVSAEVYPLDSETVTFHLVQSEPPTEPGQGNFRWREFEVEKGIAESFAKSILEILAAPDTQTAWENISKSLDVRCGEV